MNRKSLTTGLNQPTGLTALWVSHFCFIGGYPGSGEEDTHATLNCILGWPPILLGTRHLSHSRAEANYVKIVVVCQRHLGQTHSGESKVGNDDVDNSQIGKARPQDRPSDMSRAGFTPAISVLDRNSMQKASRNDEKFLRN